MVEWLTRYRGTAGSSLTRAPALCPWARHINPNLVLVQPRKTRTYITERMLMGRKESNQTKTNTCDVTWRGGKALFRIIPMDKPSAVQGRIQDTDIFFTSNGHPPVCRIRPWPLLNMTLACWEVLTQTQQQHQKGLYIHAFTWIFLDSLLLFIVIAFCFSFCAHFWNERSYLLRPTLVHIGIEGGSAAWPRDNGHTSIYFHSFSCPTWAGNKRFKLMRAYTFTK